MLLNRSEHGVCTKVIIPGLLTLTVTVGNAALVKELLDNDRQFTSQSIAEELSYSRISQCNEVVVYSGRPSRTLIKDTWMSLKLR